MPLIMMVGLHLKLSASPPSTKNNLKKLFDNINHLIYYITTMKIKNALDKIAIKKVNKNDQIVNLYKILKSSKFLKDKGVTVTFTKHTDEISMFHHNFEDFCLIIEADKNNKFKCSYMQFGLEGGTTETQEKTLELTLELVRDLVNEEC